MASLVTHRAADLQRDAARRGRVPHSRLAPAPRGDGDGVPYFSMAPGLLPGTDLIFTTMRFYQLWHSRTHQSQSHAWLHSLLSAVARTAESTHKLQQPKAATAVTARIQHSQSTR